MKYLSVLRIVLITFFFSGCFLSQTVGPVEFELGEPFVLRYGTEKLLDGGSIRIGFPEIVEDSRCPRDVVCVWEGRAVIWVWMATSPVVSDTVELAIYGYTSAADTLRHQYADIYPYRIFLLQLDPYPDTRVIVQNRNYKATLRVEPVPVLFN